MKKVFTSLLCLVFVAAGIQLAHADSPVWKVVKGERQLFIGGTLHLLAESDYPLPAAFENAYRKSAIVVFEADIQKMQSPEFQQLLQSRIIYTDGRSLKTVLTQKTYRALEQHMTSRGIPIVGFQQMKAGMVGVTQRGPVNVPTLVTSFGEFNRVYGGLLDHRIFSEQRDALPYAIQGFFNNGGSNHA